jgi:hypothetical protein
MGEVYIRLRYSLTNQYLGIRRRPINVRGDRCHYLFKPIGYFSDARQAGAILSFDQPEIVAALIPFIGVMLVLLLVWNTRATDQAGKANLEFGPLCATPTDFGGPNPGR